MGAPVGQWSRCYLFFSQGGSSETNGEMGVGGLKRHRSSQKHSEAGAWEVWTGATGEAEHQVLRYPSLPAQNTSYEQKERKPSSWEAAEKAHVSLRFVHLSEWGLGRQLTG